MARIETGYGKSMDIPLSGIYLTRVSSRPGMLTLNVNSKTYTLKLRQSTFFDPELLYAIVSPVVYSIQPVQKP